MLSIDKNLKGRNLSIRLFELKKCDKNNSTVDYLYSLIKNVNLMSSNPFASFNIEKDFVESINVIDITDITDNEELLARWYDLMQYLKINVKQNVYLAYNSYMRIYDKIKDWRYAYRAFSIVKAKKDIFKDSLNIIEDKCSKILIDLQYPVPYCAMIEVIFGLVGEETITSIENDICKKIQFCIANNCNSDAIPFVESLFKIGKINSVDCKRRKSKLIEQNADYIVANRKPDMLPNLINEYQAALKEIKDLNDCTDDIKRISEKLIREQGEFSKAIHLLCKIQCPSLDFNELYNRIVIDCKIDNPFVAYKAMFCFPIISQRMIEYQREQSKTNYSFLFECFSAHVSNNAKGATVSIKKGDNGIDDSIRQISQMVMIDYIQVFMDVIHSNCDCQIDLNYVCDHLKKLNSKFIPKDRLNLFAQGLLLGFMGDFSLASHLLLPQLENSFRYIAKQHGIITTQLAKEIQNENTMGGVLEKIHTITNEDVWTELNHFLVDGVNFRNETMHGLLSHERVAFYGIYLWWLCIKIIYNSDYYFGFKNNVNASSKVEM